MLAISDQNGESRCPPGWERAGARAHRDARPVQPRQARDRAGQDRTLGRHVPHGYALAKVMVNLVIEHFSIDN